MDLAIIPECYADTNLIETLVRPQKGYNHQKGCGTVAKKMMGFFSDRFALGIIDKDKKELNYLQEFKEVANKGGLHLLKHNTRHHYFILIRPALEQFILTNSKAAGISLADYGLPENIDELKKVTKSEKSKYDPRFSALFTDILASDNEEFLLLQSWISYLIDKNYQSLISDLQAMI